MSVIIFMDLKWSM